MIVVDASAWVTAFVDSSDAGVAARGALEADQDWAVPGHAPLEVIRTLRRIEQAGQLSSERAGDLARRVATRKVRYAAVTPELTSWVWERRHSISVYDAPYVHLALQLRAPLITLDTGLANAARPLGVTVVVPQ